MNRLNFLVVEQRWLRAGESFKKLAGGGEERVSQSVITVTSLPL